MARPALTLAQRYAARLVRLERTRSRSEDLFRKGAIRARDINHIYGAVFLSAVTSFEGFLEDLFLGLLVGRLSAARLVQSRIICLSDLVAREILLQGDQYLNWLPYEQTEKRAAAFFRGGHPFSSLEDAEKQVMRQISYTRNALAHQSRHALTVFQAKVLSQVPLLPREKNPSGFLRSNVAAIPRQTRYEQLVAELNAIAHKLCA